MKNVFKEKNRKRIANQITALLNNGGQVAYFDTRGLVRIYDSDGMTRLNIEFTGDDVEYENFIFDLITPYL